LLTNLPVASRYEPAQDNVVANATALSSLTPSVSITILDTAADVAANIDALNSNTQISAITLTDSGTPTLTLTVNQALKDTNALDEITNANDVIAVDDTAANVSASFDALNADNQISSIILTDAGTPALALTASQALNDTTALGKISNAAYDVSISDTESNVAANIDALNGDAQVGSVALTDGDVLTLTAAQALGDTNILNEITNSGFSIIVSDTVANVLSNAAALVADGKVASIAVTDTVANILANDTALQADSQLRRSPYGPRPAGHNGAAVLTPARSSPYARRPGSAAAPYRSPPDRCAS
jgi:hypothetical protein